MSKECETNYIPKYDFSMPYNEWLAEYKKGYKSVSDNFIKNICSHRGTIKMCKNNIRKRKVR